MELRSLGDIDVHPSQRNTQSRDKQTNIICLPTDQTNRRCRATRTRYPPIQPPHDRRLLPLHTQPDHDSRVITCRPRARRTINTSHIPLRQPTDGQRRRHPERRCKGFQPQDRRQGSHHRLIHTGQGPRHNRVMSRHASQGTPRAKRALDRCMFFCPTPFTSPHLSSPFFPSISPQTNHHLPNYRRKSTKPTTNPSGRNSTSATTQTGGTWSSCKSHDGNRP